MTLKTEGFERVRIIKIQVFSKSLQYSDVFLVEVGYVIVFIFLDAHKKS